MVPMIQTMWLEDLNVSDRFYSGEEIEVTAEEIMSFARQYDPQPGHISEETALDTSFHGLAASGWHTAAITQRLLTKMGFIGVIGADITLTWPTPTRPGDRLHFDGRVTSKRESRTKPDRGIVSLEYDTVNQDGEIRQHTQAVIIAYHRPS